MFLYKSLKQRDEEEDVQVQSLLQRQRWSSGPGSVLLAANSSRHRVWLFLRAGAGAAAAFPCNNTSVAALGLLERCVVERAMKLAPCLEGLMLLIGGGCAGGTVRFSLQ